MPGRSQAAHARLVGTDRLRVLRRHREQRLLHHHPAGVARSTRARWAGRSQGVLHICDEEGNELPAGETGLVYFSDGPEFEYHNDPARTAQTRNAKGWSTLGDIGRLDDEGYLYLVDRRAFMIISGGVNIYPQEAESVLDRPPQGGRRGGDRRAQRRPRRGSQGRRATAGPARRRPGHGSRTPGLLQAAHGHASSARAASTSTPRCPGTRPASSTSSWCASATGRLECSSARLQRRASQVNANATT